MPSGPYKEFRKAIWSLERLHELRRRCRREELPASSAAALAGAGRRWPGQGGAALARVGAEQGGIGLASGRDGAALVWRGAGQGGVARGWPASEEAVGVGGGSGRRLRRRSASGRASVLARGGEGAERLVWGNGCGGLRPLRAWARARGAGAASRPS
jgi:hypothetical protein